MQSADRKPRFSLGGQVTAYSNSTSNLAAAAAAAAAAGPPLQSARSYSHLLRDMDPHLVRSLNPELLMREFTRDEQETTNSPSSMFKSSFAKEVVHNVRNSVSSAGHHQSHKRPDGADQDVELVSAVDDQELDENLWMSSTQFIQLLDKEEAKEVEKYHFEADNKRQGEEEEAKDLTISFLDQEARIPFHKLKQTCVSLGFKLSPAAWNSLSQKLIDDGLIEGDDGLVRNCNFFSALNVAIREKSSYKDKELRRNLRLGKNIHQHLRGEQSFKDSMKSSDSGGDLELESCRSSDSGLERELAEREREIIERDRELSRCHRDLAERDTDLVRVRMECQRLLECNRELRQANYYKNPVRYRELEKEIDNLRWQLSQMESSRKTYELATQRLVSFLDEVTTALQTTSPAYKRFVESTRAEVSRVARRARQTSEAANKRHSIDSFISRAESMPGLNLELSSFGSSGSTLSTGTSSSGRRNIVQRSQSTHSKRSSMPPPPISLQTVEENSGYENHSVIQEARRNNSIEVVAPVVKKQNSFSVSRRPSCSRVDGDKTKSTVIQIDGGNVRINNTRSSSTTTKQSKEKCKNLGSLQIEPSLPSSPISENNEVESREKLLSRVDRMKKSMKSLLAREKTITITPKKGSRSHSNSVMGKAPSLQLLSHTSFPGLPAFPVLAASHTSPWNC